MKLLYIVGFGPGHVDGMTLAARQAIENSELVIGYTVYVELLRGSFPEKEYRATGMRQEAQRVRMALAAAAGGKTTAFVCSGDSVVYAMAGLAFQLKAAYPGVELQVVPGVTAALSGGAVLGAPLTGDFAVISLSDLLTPWEKIEKRLECAALGDFAIAIYNPASRHRPDHLRRACEILLRHKSPATVCGWVKNIGREGQSCQVLTLGELASAQVDMFTTVFIGSAETLELDGKMVTPRGYRDV